MTIESNNDTDRAPTSAATTTTISFNPADAVDVGDDFAEEPAAASSDTPPTNSSALRDIVPASPREEYEPERDANGDPRPYINGEWLLSALKYVLVACPKPSEDDSLLSYVVVSHDVANSRVSFTACDTNRWHQAYVACELGIDLRGTFRLAKADVQRLKDFLTTAVERGSFCNVRPKSSGIGVIEWEIAFGGAHPLVIDVMPSFAHENWQPPAFAIDARAGVAAMHDARHVAKALTIPGAESTRVVLDAVDSAGRRHLSIADEFGHELARAVLVQLGFSEGEPVSPQKEIPGTIGTPDRVRTAPPDPAKKPAAKAPKGAAKPVKPAKASKPASKGKAKGKKRGR